MNSNHQPRRSCQTCRYWAVSPHSSNGVQHGECHRMPPTPILVGMRQPTLATSQPPSPVAAGFRTPVKATDWCGEWQGKIGEP